jgi:DNA repair exonuclease SbcCD ATPase subunit
VQAAPIRKGEKSAKIVLKLKGDGRELIVTRKFNRKDDGDYTTSLVVENQDGARFTKGQSTLDELIGELSFDPLAFTRMSAKEQFEALRQFVPGIDFAAIDGANQRDYERRTEVNKAAREATAAANTIVVPEGTPEEPIDEDALTTEMKAAATLNQDVERRKGLRAQAAKDVEGYRAQAQLALDAIAPALEEINQRLNAALAGIDAQIDALKKQREALLDQSDPEFQAAEKKLRDQAATFTKTADDLQDRLDAAEVLPALIDTDAIARRMGDARKTNAQVERARQRAVHLTTAKKYVDEAAQLTANIEARTKQKQEAVAAAKMPVPGVGFGDGVVLLDGVPFEQASDAQRLRASVAIAMAANPKLRVIRVRDGSLLDDDSMRILGEMCDANDFQCWVETVAGDGKNAFVIEDGHVRQADAGAERSAA